MVTLPVDTLTKWRSKVIKRKGKIELIKRFVERFSMSDAMIEKYLEASREPTPEQYNWIVAEVDRYYLHYSKNLVPEDQSPVLTG